MPLTVAGEPRQVRKLMDALEKDENVLMMELFDEIDEAQKVWGVREGGLGATVYVPGEADHWPG